jgi:hypothetical protein
MFPDNLGHGRISQIREPLGPQAGMFATIPQADGFGDVVEQGSGFQERQGYCRSGLQQVLAQHQGHIPDPAAMLLDIRQHLVGRH